VVPHHSAHLLLNGIALRWHRHVIALIQQGDQDAV
jgi:hypothetical protein